MKTLICLFLVMTARLGFGQSSEIFKDFRQPSEQSRSANVEILNRSIQNRALATGLASNANSINRSVEDLMESLFYSIMDQNVSWTASDSLNLTTAYRRDVEETSIGTYVVIDHFRFGPDFFREVGKVRGLPISVQNQSNVFLTNVTYRSDALRKSESQQVGRWRELANNWFGALPFLTGILPPSFNPEELYDPISYLQTPFLFPSDSDESLEMPIGNVRSYGIAGSTGPGLDLVGRSIKDLQDDLSLSDLTLKLPLSAFYEGQHQISVLRARDNEVWLALTEIRRLGALLNIEIGKRYQIFQKVFKWWAGVPATIAPVDFDLERSTIWQIDEMYSYDLTKETARKALNDALNGKLAMSRKYGKLQDTDELLENGVIFQFRRFSTKDEDTTQQGRSLYVLQNQRQRQLDVGESSTRDREGEFFSLDTEQIIQDRDWNVLVGAETVEYKLKLSVPITKEHVPTESGKRTTVHKLDLTQEEPLALFAGLKIIDNFHDTRDHNRLLGIIRTFAGLEMTTLPDIPMYAKDLEQRYIQEQALSNPMDEAFRKQVPTTNLGKLEANAQIYFSHDLMLEIAKKSPAEFWRNFAIAFAVDPIYWAEQGPDPSWGYYANWMTSYALMPLRLMNLQSEFSDFVLETSRVRAALDQLIDTNDPMRIVTAYRDLIDTSHPAELVHGLALLVGNDRLPINVSFSSSTSEKREDSPDTRLAKKEFSKINQRSFRTSTPMPPIKRNQTVEEKLAAFSPGGFRNPKRLPKLQRLTLYLEEKQDPEAKFSHQELVAELMVQDPPSRKEKLPIYLRIEQAGVINVGRFVLTEELRDLEPTPLSDARQRIGRVGLYRLPLSGPEGLQKQDFLNQAILEGGAFDVFISLSDQGSSWTAEQNMSFVIENGLLKKLY